MRQAHPARHDDLRVIAQALLILLVLAAACLVIPPQELCPDPDAPACAAAVTTP